MQCKQQFQLNFSSSELKTFTYLKYLVPNSPNHVYAQLISYAGKIYCQIFIYEFSINSNVNNQKLLAEYGV